MPQTAPPLPQPHAPDLLDRRGVAWRVEHAGRAACLIDAAAYYGTLRRALLSARRQVLILGWDVDGRTRLTGEDEPEDDAPRTLRDFLAWLVQQRPDLHIHILLWDYTLLYSLDREPLPKVSLGWTTPDRVHLHLDNRIPIAASHHEKIVVIDDALAFCGGMDLSVRRWDTPEHRPDDPRRRDPGGGAYAPVHDVQMMVAGPAAAALGDLCRERWRRSKRRRLAAPEPGLGPLWPTGVEAAFRDVRVAVSRTRPRRRPRRAVCEIRDLYCAAIADAERFVVIENQYLTAEAVASALADRLRRNPRLEVLLIGPRTAMDWLEETTMGTGRAAFMARLAGSGAGDRVRLLAPVVRDDDGRDHDVKVHSKLMVVDDRVLTVGSANLANRSMGLDSETNLTLVADRPDHATAITALRRRLLAEHAGVTTEDIEAVETATGGLFAALDQLTRRDPRRDLVPVTAEAVEADGSVVLLNRLGDPEEPLDLERVLAEQVPPPPDHPRRHPRHLWTGLVLVAVLAAAVAAWTLTPLREGLDPDVFLRWADRMRGTPWTPLAVLAAYLVLGLIAFPITVLITVTAMVFGPWLGFVYAGIGSIAAAALAFWVGHALGRGLVQRYAGRGVNRMSKALGDRGIVAVVFLRVAPVAPFVLINLVAGASHVRFRDYLTGTVLGMLPGIAVMTLLGSSIMDLIESPSPGRIALLVGCLALWLAVSVWLQRLVARRRQAGGGDGDDES